MIQLRDYQRAAIDALWDYFRSGAGGNPIVACPTGAGKSVIQAVFLEEALTQFPTTRVLCATHVGELVQQNAMGIRKNWPQVPMGIYAAGLGQRNLGQQVTVASIQSIYKRAAALGKVDLLMIDEAQLISRKGEGMYRKLIDALMETNPMMKVIGLTATPYRMDSGSLIDPEEGTIFTDLCYDIELGFLVEQGYLSPLQSKKPTAVFDLSDLKPKSRGDWTESDLSEVVDTDKNNGPAVAEMYQLAHDRKKWLVFAVNVAHAHNLNRLISAGGRKSRVIEGSMDKATRAQYIAMYQRGELDCLVNVNVLSVGFDAPDVDMLALCRPTQSVGLYVQQLGRGLRISPGKHDCLVLDFAGNIAAHGPVDCIPTLPPKRKKKVKNEDGEEMAPGKVCGNPQCEQFVHASVRVCPHCGHEFPKAEIAIEEEAETEAVMTLTRDVTVKPWKEVKSRVFTIHTPAGEGRISSIKCRTTVQRTKKMEAAANEFICVEHSGRAGAAAREWWIKQGGHFPAPTTLDEFMGRQDELYRLTHAIIVRDGNFWNITEHGHFDALAQTDDYEVVADE